MTTKPRLPVLPVNPYVGPVVEQAALPPALPTDFEAETIDLGAEWPAPERTVYTTKRRWRACDVYFSTDSTTFPGTFQIFVWAITSGARALVASGRFKIDSLPRANKWIAAARAVCDRFEVSAFYDSNLATNPNGKCKITVVASDQAVDPPKMLGSVRFAQNVGFTGGLGQDRILRPEIVGISAVNGAAAARYFQIHYAVGNVALGRVPELVFPMGDVAGKGFYDYDLNLRIEGGTADAIELIAWGVSSTPQTFTSAVDCRWTVFLR